MALLNLVPTSATLQVVQGAGQSIDMACKDSTGANVNMAGLNAYRIKVFVSGGSGSASPLLSKTTGFTGSSGNLNFVLAATDASSLPPGTYQFIAEAQNGSGDDFQLVQSGSVIIKAAA